MKSFILTAIYFFLTIASFSSAETNTGVTATSATQRRATPNVSTRPTSPLSAGTTLATSTSTSSSGGSYVVEATNGGGLRTGPSSPASVGGTEGGAAGASGSTFKLSNGAIIAIAVVIGVVAILGIGFTVLYFIARRRGWSARRSMRRMSRRLTGRFDPKDEKRQAERRKRSGVIAGSKPAVRTATPPGKQRSVVVEVKDEEKGSGSHNGPAAPPPSVKKWTDKFMGNRQT